MYKTIKVELSYGCNMRCSFCGIQSEPKLVPKLMTEETMTAIFQRIAEDRRRLTVSFSLRGEPTLNPAYLDAIQQASIVAHRVIMVTNGTLISARNVTDMFSAGLDALHIDVYNDTAAKLVECLPNDSTFVVRRYGGKNKIWTTRIPIVVVCDERDSRQNNTRALHNWAGANKNNQRLNEEIPRQAPCAEPLKMITIRHDGSYGLCCQTWNDLLELGSVRDASPEELYYSETYQKLCTAIMQRGGRAHSYACKSCNVKSPYAFMFRRAIGEQNRI